MRHPAWKTVCPVLLALLWGSVAGLPARGQAPPADPTGADTGTTTEPPLPAEAPPQAMTDQARLEQAVRYYQLGERDEARHILAALVVAPGLDAALRQDARVYLAELLVFDGDVEGARDFLKQVLLEDPDYAIDPFRHAPEVTGEFDYVKALFTPVRPPDEPPPAAVVVTMPLSVWSPFGRYHFAEGRPVRGLVYFTGVTASAAASGFLWGLTHADRRYLTRSAEPAYESLDELDLRSLRRAQWTATGLFYGFWGASVIDAQVHWRNVGMKAAVQPSVGSVDGRAAPGLRVHGTF